jgi:hypothetical protein
LRTSRRENKADTSLSGSSLISFVQAKTTANDDDSLIPAKLAGSLKSPSL